MKSLTDFVKESLKNNTNSRKRTHRPISINEMADNKSVFEGNVFNLAPKIAEHILLCCSAIKQHSNTKKFSHWASELMAHVNNLADKKIKNRDKKKVRKNSVTRVFINDKHLLDIDEVKSCIQKANERESDYCKKQKNKGVVEELLIVEYTEELYNNYCSVFNYIIYLIVNEIQHEFDEFKEELLNHM